MRKVAHTSLVYFRLSENWIHTQLKYLQGWESVVLTNHKENLELVDWKPSVYSREDQLPFLLRALDSLAMWTIGYYPSFYRQAKNEKIDLVHAHFGTMGYLSSALIQAIDVPLITTFYGYDASLLPKREPQWKSRYQKLFDRGSRFLVEGPAMKKKLEGLGCPSEKVTVHHLGVELDQFPRRDKYRSDESMKILMVGRFVEKKGFIYGLKAFRKYLENGGEGTLTIIGDRDDTTASGETKEELLEFVDQHKLNDVVNFKGMIPLKELQKEYYQHDLFLAPSVEAKNGDNEGGAPVTIIEASATGMPIVGSYHCDIPEVVKDGETGLMAKEKEIEKLSEYLLELFKQPKFAKQLGQAGAEYIQNSFNAEKQGKVLSQIYDECLGI